MDLPKIYEKRSTRWALSLVTSALTLSSCQKQFVKERTTDNRAATLAAALGAGKSQNVTYTIDQATGRITATLSASALVTQEISASGAGLSGISVSFPPGSLAISTDINVQEAVTIAMPNTAAALGISGSITGVGASVAIQPSVVADPANAFTVALQIPSASSLRLAGNSANLVAIYKVNVYAKNKILDGVIPLSGLTVEGDKVKFSSRYFGAFQLAYTDTLVTTATEVETTVPIQSKVEAGVLAPLNITARSPIVVRAGDTVTLSGNNFRPTMTLALGSKSVSKVNVASDVSASFVVPSELNAGVLPLLANQDGVSQTISLLYTPGTTSYPVITLPPAEVCSGQSYYDVNGTLQAGSKNCTATAAAPCASDGATGCMATPSYPAVDLTKLDPGVIKSGVTIAGVGGQFPSPNYPLTGPVGSAALAELQPTTMNTLLASASQFKWWDATGMFHSAAGSNDLTAGHILTGYTIFGAAGTVVPRPSDCAYDGQSNCVVRGDYVAANLSNIKSDGWDLRAGLTIAGISGKLPLNCRNQVSPSVFSIGAPKSVTIDTSTSKLLAASHGFSNGQQVRLGFTTAPSPNTISDSVSYYVTNSTTGDFQISTAAQGSSAISFSSAGANVKVYSYGINTPNVYSTIDDKTNVTGTAYSNPWASANRCGGVEATLGDDKVWRDATLDANGAVSSCSTSPANCTFQDKITRLKWSKMATTTSNWTDAIVQCEQTTGTASSGWRLPTQKELMSAYEHGIVTASNSNWISSTAFVAPLWSSTTSNENGSNAWTLGLLTGNAAAMPKNGANQYICVHD